LEHHRQQMDARSCMPLKTAKESSGHKRIRFLACTNCGISIGKKEKHVWPIQHHKGQQPAGQLGITHSLQTPLDDRTPLQIII
jgi:hypothetical protein